MKVSTLVDEYIKFQSNSLSPYHVVDNVVQDLQNGGFAEFLPNSNQTLQTGKGYYLIHPQARSVIAFVCPDFSAFQGAFSVVCAHTDSPVLKLRLNPWTQEDSSVCQLQTQLHGSLIFRSWLDRPLMLAGRVYRHQDADDKNGGFRLPKVTSQTVASSKPIGVIPDLAIHLDREKNKRGKIDPERALSLICGQTDNLNQAKELMQGLLGLSEGYDAFDLYLAPNYEHQVCGIDDSYLVGPRHDDLAMVFAATKSLIEANKLGQKALRCPMIAFFDSEETGSQTSGGAMSGFLTDTIKMLMGHSAEQSLDHPSFNISKNSFVLSADMAHAFHPSHKDSHDKNHRPVINKGLVVKENANDRYATCGYAVALVKKYAQQAELSLQDFVARQDMGCGSTIGPIVATQLGCLTADVGPAMWGMHSAAETMGTQDLLDSVKLFTQVLSH